MDIAAIITDGIVNTSKTTGKVRMRNRKQKIAFNLLFMMSIVEFVVCGLQLVCSLVGDFKTSFLMVTVQTGPAWQQIISSYMLALAYIMPADF